MRNSINTISEKKGIPEELRATIAPFSHAISGLRSLILLLWWARNQNCSNASNRIYGILSLFSSALSAKLQPDYTLTTGQVYQDMVLAQYSLRKRLCLLGHCDLRTRCPGAPTWVPNFDAKEGSLLLAHGHASGSSASHVTLIPEDKLDVVGTFCGWIQSVGVAVESDADQMVEAIRSWEPNNLLSSNYVTGEPMFDAFIELVFRVRNE